jgi:pectinesterase
MIRCVARPPPRARARPRAPPRRARAARRPGAAGGAAPALAQWRLSSGARCRGMTSLMTWLVLLACCFWPAAGSSAPGLSNSCAPGSCRSSSKVWVGGGGGGAGAGRPSCRTIQAAVNCCPPTHQRKKQKDTVARFTILVASGVYRERVVINQTNIAILGQAEMAPQPQPFALPSSAVVIMWSVPNQAVLNVTADDVTISNVTAYNNANRFQIGKNSGLYVTAGDRTAVFFSSFFGAQDTIYTGHQRVYFYGCRINGTTDFNYGQGAAVFDECVLVGERAGNFYNGQSFLTATTGNVTSGHTPDNPVARSAFLLRNCRLPASPRIGSTYLGRPWGDGATVIYDSCWMDRHIAPDGWEPQNNWRKIPCHQNDSRCADTFYAEHNSLGPGANSSARVKWSHQLTIATMEQWSPLRVLRGWVPQYAATHSLDH